MLDWCRAKGLTAYDRRTHEGFLRNLVVREGRRTGQIQVRLVTMPGALDTDGLAEAVDCNGLPVDGVRRRRRDDRARRDGADLRQRLPRRGAQRPAVPHLPARLLPDEHRNGGEALRARRRVRRAERLRARLRPLLRDRHDWPDACAARVRAVGPGADRAGDRRRDLEREAERDRQRQLLRGRRARRVERAGQAGGPPDLVVVDPPRAGLSSKVVRRIIDSSPKRIVYVSCNPTTLAPNAAQLVEAGYILARDAGRHVPADAAHRVRRAAGAVAA